MPNPGNAGLTGPEFTHNSRPDTGNAGLKTQGTSVAAGLTAKLDERSRTFGVEAGLKRHCRSKDQHISLGEGLTKAT
jgi:hypothetical protein